MAALKHLDTVTVKLPPESRMSEMAMVLGDCFLVYLAVSCRCLVRIKMDLSQYNFLNNVGNKTTLRSGDVVIDNRLFLIIRGDYL